MKFLVLIVMFLMTSMSFAQRPKSLPSGGPKPMDCRLVKFSDPKAYEKCCQMNPKTCGGVDYSNVNCRDIKDTVPPKEFAACCKQNPKTCGNANGDGNGGGEGAHCKKGWLEVIKCGYGIDYKNCGCLPETRKK